MQKKITKRALLVSLISLLLCSTMLIGSTFAWFSDTAATSVNKIEAGRLDVQLEYKNSSSEDFSEVTENTNVFLENTLWEPGHLEYVVLRISNGGSLALKYTLGVHVVSETGSRSVQGNEFKLSDYLKFAVLDGQVTNRDTLITAATNGTVLSAGYSAETPKLLPTEEAKLVTLAVWFPSTIGNEANYAAGQEQPKIDLGIDLTATQASHENDSYGNTYDDGAAYPVIITSQSELNEAITGATNKEATITLPANASLTLDNDIANSGEKSRNITFVGNGTQTIDVVANSVSAEGGQLNYQRGSTFTFENMTIQAGEGNFDGIVCDELVYRNCTIKGKLTLYGMATFINCVFENTMANQYSIWTWGGTDVTFKDCTFNTNGKAILLYGQATAEKPTNLTVTHCIFNDWNNGTVGKAAIEVGNDYHATYTLTVDQATVNGFANGKNTGSKLWANKNSMDTEHLSVTIDGVKVQ